MGPHRHARSQPRRPGDPRPDHRAQGEIRARGVQTTAGRRAVLYPDGSRIRKLATKCAPRGGFHVAVELRVFLSTKGVNLSGEQQTKTNASTAVLRCRPGNRCRALVALSQELRCPQLAMVISLVGHSDIRSLEVER
jgi:hypothetical protein